MEMVYLINGGESGGGSGGGGGRAVGYPFAKVAISGGKGWLEDRSINFATLETDGAVSLAFPGKTVGAARDFLLRLVITADTLPEVTFASPAGEAISFEEADGETFRCETGVNVFAFTETSDGVFIVNRKMVAIRQMVAFDPGGGSVSPRTMDYTLGHTYNTLPIPTRDGFSFLGWFTDGGVEVSATDTVKSSVSRLVARWDDYIDKYAAAISLTDGLVFMSTGDALWTLDEDVDGHATCARSGAIPDGKTSSLKVKVEGPGTLSFSWKASSEANCDKGTLLIGLAEPRKISGETEWQEVSIPVEGEGVRTVEWRYRKDASISRGSDCIWLDDVKWEAS